MALVDVLGNLARFVLLPGQRHDCVGVASLIDGIETAALIGDKAFDNDWLRKELDDRSALAVIPPKVDRARPISCDFEMYKWRHLIENFFCNSPQAFPPSCASWNLKPAPLKQWRRIATRYDKTDQSFAAMINLTAAIMALK
jgi:transposase